MPKTQLVYVTEREGDIYEVYERAEQLDCSCLIRSARDRNTTEGAKLYTLKEAIEKVQWYRCRWQIEVFFKILKSGCGVDKLQLQRRHGLENAVSVMLIVAWRIHFLSS